jgi:hypothetical protein
MYRRVVTFLFPAVLVWAEYVVRSKNKAEPIKFLAPTVSSVSLGFLFPLMAVEDKTPNGTAVNGCVITTGNAADEDVAKVATTLVFVFTIGWVIFLFYATDPNDKGNPEIFGLPTVAYAMLMYFFSALLAELKETK